MSNEAEEPLKRVHLLLYEDDYHWLMSHVGGKDKHGFSRAIRRIVRSWRRQLEDKSEELRRQSGAKLSTDELNATIADDIARGDLIRGPGDKDKPLAGSKSVLD